MAEWERRAGGEEGGGRRTAEEESNKERLQISESSQNKKRAEEHACVCMCEWGGREVVVRRACRVTNAAAEEQRVRRQVFVEGEEEEQDKGRGGNSQRKDETRAHNSVRKRILSQGHERGEASTAQVAVLTSAHVPPPSSPRLTPPYLPIIESIATHPTNILTFARTAAPPLSPHPSRSRAERSRRAHLMRFAFSCCRSRSTRVMYSITKKQITVCDTQREK